MTRVRVGIGGSSQLDNMSSFSSIIIKLHAVEAACVDDGLRLRLRGEHVAERAVAVFARPNVQGLVDPRLELVVVRLFVAEHEAHLLSRTRAPFLGAARH